MSATKDDSSDEQVVAKRQKKANEEPISPFDSEQYLWPLLQMQRLRSQWNSLDQCPYTGDYHGTEERKEYLKDMNQILRHGVAEYRNPFGADDRENFGGVFQDLTDREQEAFFNAITKAMRAKRPVSEQDIKSLFANPPDLPYYISLSSTDKSSPYQDGSDRFPFKSVEAAVARYNDLRWNERGGEEFPLVIVDCGPDCRYQECYQASCKTPVCLEHGSRRGVVAEGDVVFVVHKCKDCGKIACNRHGFKKCDVCSNRFAGEVLLGMHEGYDTFPVCKECATVCQGKVENMEEPDEDASESDESKVCGFRCCKECLANHRCGDDPTEYC